jgi:hypothetical protein
MGDATRGSPIPLQGGIKAHILCEENVHLRHVHRLIEALQSVTISLSRACLYPPSKVARPFLPLFTGVRGKDSQKLAAFRGFAGKLASPKTFIADSSALAMVLVGWVSTL